MLIHLHKSKLFTQNPADRFADTYDLDPDWWYELWRRFAQLAYTPSELCEWLEIRTKVKIRRQTMDRWIIRNEIYIRAQPIIKKGVQTVTTEFFVPYEAEVIKEITRNMKGHLSQSSKTIV